MKLNKNTDGVGKYMKKLNGNITATEIVERENQRWEDYKKSPGKKALDDKQAELLEPILTKLQEMMEKYANAPKEGMGKRTPGETCMYERKGL